MPRKDFNQVAFDILQRVTGEVKPKPVDPKKKAAAEAGRRGGLKGGAARAKALTPAKRKRIAKKAAAARWKRALG